MIGAVELGAAKSGMRRSDGMELDVYVDKDDGDDDFPDDGAAPPAGVPAAAVEELPEEPAEVAVMHEETDPFAPSPEEERTALFLSDTSSHLRVFFSSYFRDRGLVWSAFLSTAKP
jgi:hypothetical protein